jgi:ribosomal protein S14
MMKKLVEKDKSKRKLFFDSEIKRVILKSITRNQNLTNRIRWVANLYLSDMLVNSSKVRQVNRCIITGRKSKVRGCYKFSRLVFLRMVRNGLISGLKKST